MSRNTHQKQTVLRVLQTMRGQHPTAEAVFDQVARIIPSISRATVYRILGRYAEEGSVAKVHAFDSAIRYDVILSPHQHLLCDGCNRLVDLPAFEMPAPVMPRDEVAGCRITGVEMIFRGVCPECAARTSRRSKSLSPSSNIRIRLEGAS